MRTASVLAAAFAAVTSVVASQDAARPQHNFPRYYKRQFTNITITSEESFPPSSSLESTKRQESSDSDSSRDTRVTTVIITSTIYPTAPAPSSPTDGNSGLFSSRPDATTENSPDASPSSDDSSVSPSSGSSSDSSASETSSSSSDSSASETSSDSTTPTETSSNTEPELSSPTSSPEPTETSTSDLVDETTATSSEESTESTSSPSSEPPVPTASTSEIIIAPTGIVTSTSAEDGDSISSILSDINSMISDIFGPTETTSSAIVIPTLTGPGTGITTSETPTATDQITEPTAPPTSIDTSSPVLPITNSTVTDPGTTNPATSGDPIFPTTSITTGGGNVTVTSAPEPTATLSPTVSFNTTSAFPTNGTNTVVVPPETTTTPLPPPTTTVTPPTSSSSSVDGVTSLPPLTTVTNSEPWFPTTIRVAPTSSTPTGSPTTTPSGIPSDLPSAIAPNNGVQEQPEDTMLIQIGFREGYNYRFVVADGRAAAQIFRLLPEALSDAGGFSIDKAQVKRLVPLDTQSSLGYITTCAIVTYPISMVEALSSDIRLPNSALYNNEDQLIYNFTQQINPAIPIIIGEYPDGTGGVAGGEDNSGDDSSGGGSNSDPFGNSGNTGGDQSGAQRGTTAGIVSGAVAVAAAYGAVMFVVARRYKRKKQMHRRASSIGSSNPDMGEYSRGSPALMGGALLSRDFTSSYGAVPPGGRDSHGSGRSGMGGSGRTQFISAPVAAENSLGWN
ncbi:hypothetical protein VTK26DRAFT_5504 [Humicola hyalothermophila]